MFRRLILLSAMLGLHSASSGIAVRASGEPAASPISTDDRHFFEKSVRPLLVTRCLKCHGGTKMGAPGDPARRKRHSGRHVGDEPSNGGPSRSLPATPLVESAAADVERIDELLQREIDRQGFSRPAADRRAPCCDDLPMTSRGYRQTPSKRSRSSPSSHLMRGSS